MRRLGVRTRRHPPALVKKAEAEQLLGAMLSRILHISCSRFALTTHAFWKKAKALASSRRIYSTHAS